MSASQSVIFDLDGTLIESEQVWRDVREVYTKQHGGRWHDGAQGAMMGLRTTEWAHYMHDELKVNVPPETIAQQVITEVAARLQDAPVLPGATEALERLSRDFVLALATSAALSVAQSVLASTGWKKLFTAVVSADEVPRGKPAPDVYVRALELLHADPAQAAAVEDSANGIRSAHAAGVAVIAIPNHEFPPDTATLALASHVADNLDALSAEMVRSVLS